MQKIKKEEDKGAYLQAPTFATIVKLFLFSHFYCHHVEAPLAKALLKLPTFEILMDFAFLKF